MLIVFILAFCSIVYEFLLSQVLAALLGGTFLRYTTTIALYIFSLGLGAFYYQRIKELPKIRSLFTVELILSSIGVMIPVIAILGESYLPHSIAVIYCYFLVLLVGFLSGIELPLLMDIEEAKNKRGGLRALAVDFFGTFLGCILFPLFFLTQLGVFTTASLVGTLNLVVAFVLLKRMENKAIAIPISLLVVALCLFSYWPGLQEWVVNGVYLK